MKFNRSTLQWVLVVGGIIVLGVTYKADVLSPVMGYPLGIAMIVSVIWGKEIGQFMMVIGGLLALIQFLSPRFLSRTLDIETNGWVLAIVWGIIGGLLFFVGANATKYFCAACDQYLGTSYKQCPRCGSNRYRTVSED